ncbi:hypothetical protein L1987_35865 [Smallanthus sonchifolius]|uniref:Uncharacterized protein n=1 Tax=Smallanthus sonchifolius TaxID=185202 RepID=A0ACB9HC01_9ASTR|nr:hypothetical protein L1987_35865 [Smallanthus sonchifolius]
MHAPRFIHPKQWWHRNGAGGSNAGNDEVMLVASEVGKSDGGVDGVSVGGGNSGDNDGGGGDGSGGEGDDTGGDSVMQWWGIGGGDCGTDGGSNDGGNDYDERVT